MERAALDADAADVEMLMAAGRTHARSSSGIGSTPANAGLDEVRWVGFKVGVQGRAKLGVEATSPNPSTNPNPSTDPAPNPDPVPNPNPHAGALGGHTPSARLAPP